MLNSWQDGPAKRAIEDFVGRVTSEGPHFVAAEDRIGVFDNDGTLWCEKPAYVQLDFLIRRLAALAEADPSLRQRRRIRPRRPGIWRGSVQPSPSITKATTPTSK
jgi:hypothetical protein